MATGQGRPGGPRAATADSVRTMIKTIIKVQRAGCPAVTARLNLGVRKHSAGFAKTSVPA